MPKSFQSKVISQDKAEKTPNSSDVSEMESVYKSLEHVEKPASVSSFSRPLTSGIIGLIAGVAGSLIVVGDLFGISSRVLGQDVMKSMGTGRTVVLERRERIDVPWEEVETRIYADISQQVYSVFKKKKPVSNDLLDALYFSEEAVGSSVGVTADGWFVTVKNVMKDQKIPYVVLIGSKPYDVDMVVPDPGSNITYFRVRAENIVPVRFVSKPLVAGTLVVVGRGYGVGFEGILSALAAVDVRNITLKSPFESAEKLSSYVSVDMKTPIVPGAGMFSLNGELLGLHDGDFGFIPASRIVATLPGVLKQKSVSITELGVTVLDLGTVALGSDLILPSFGYRIQSIKSTSPAQRAKLQVGDVILSIEDERVGVSKSIFERIQEYPPETSVTFELLRGADTIKVSVMLGEGK